MVRVAPSLALLRADRSVGATVARFVEDEHLRQALSFLPLLVGGNPFETSSIYTLIHYLERKWGVFFHAAGRARLIRALVTAVRGARRRAQARREECSSIELDRSHARPQHLISTASRRRERFDAVVSNSDLHHTYSTLYGHQLPAQPMREKLEKAEWSMSLFVLYFGTNRSWDIAHHSVLFGAPLPRAPRETCFHGTQLARGLQPLPARPERHRSFARTTRLRLVLRARARSPTSATRRSIGTASPLPTLPASYQALDRYMPGPASATSSCIAG